jgi:hypothetical protein
MSSLENRRFPAWLVFLQGSALGLLAFGLSEISIPHASVNGGVHDVLLAQRLGLIYTPAVGVWLGWMQRSRSRVIGGAIVGLVIGLVYYVLCLTYNFFAIMVMFPCLLGGGLAALVGSNRSRGVGAFFARLAKGLIAGLVLGYTYMYLLNFILDAVQPPEISYGPGYPFVMWEGGLPAMGIASGLFLLLTRWAVGLVRLRFDEAA